MVFKNLTPPKEPKEGSRIRIDASGNLIVPDNPIIPFIEGDGTGAELTAAMKRIVDIAVKMTYGGKKKISWFEIFAGQKAFDKYKEWLPEDSVQAIREYHVAIKGPLTTPISGGIRSLNVALRQKLDLYACIRPCKDYGAPSPVKNPADMDLVIFRENTEDVYMGLEWKVDSPEAKKIREFFKKELNVQLREDAGIGLKPISKFGTQRLVRMAIKYAIDHKCPTVTLVHKGNIQKFTEGAFRDWGYAVAKEEFGDKTITEKELEEIYQGKMPVGKILINDRIADNTFQQILTRTKEFSVLATSNLNGDYLSDAAAAQIGGLGIAPGANIGNGMAFFEATHGTAPKYTGQNKVNPIALTLSACLMLDYLGWKEASEKIQNAIRKTIAQKKVTYDFARLMGAPALSLSQCADAIIQNL